VLKARLLTQCRIALLLTLFLPFRAISQDAPKPAPDPPQTKSTAKQTEKHAAQQAASNEQQELQKAIEDAGNDRAAMVRNLEGFLQKYPESSQRAQIFRALVESTLQLRDFSRATEYAERLVAINPEDISMTLLAIQLLDRHGDAVGWRRGVSYCTRVIDQLSRTPLSEKSPRVSTDEWETDKRRDKSSLLLVRGRLYKRLNEIPNAQKDFETSYALLPNAAAAERLGEIAEMKKDPTLAVQDYARAFALTDATNGASSRAELRKKIGNVWRLAHGSEDGLGDYLLRTFDEVAASTKPAKAARNQGLKEPYEFTLRKAPDGSPFPFADAKGKVVVLNFWATWCGPCRELEPHFEKLAARYAQDKGVLFFGLNCDEDEALVAPYLEEEKPKTPTLFADGLERLLRVDSFPTTVILDRTGKIAFRSNGFDPDTVDKVLSEAVERVLHAPDTPAATAASSP
jgi:thiol-disulfide isomerase/thioredoxin